MRLSEWREKAPLPEAASDRVMAVVQPLLVDLGARADAECWVVWGEDPGMKYSILSSSLAGLITVAVRPIGGEEGPRATAKLVRWSKLNVSELSVEASGGHRIVAVQVDSHVLKGFDDEADRICEFVRGLVAGIENRSAAQVVVPGIVAMAAPSAAEGVVAAPPAASPRAAGAAAGSRARRSGANESVDGAPKALPDKSDGAAARFDSDSEGARSGRARGAGKAAPLPGDGASAEGASEGAGHKGTAAHPSHSSQTGGVVPASAATAAPGSSVPGSGAPANPPAKSPEPSPASSPAAPPATTAPAAPLRPLTSREAALHDPAHHPAAAAKPKPQREEWVSPHPIVEPNAVQKNKPRRWTP